MSSRAVDRWDSAEAAEQWRQGAARRAQVLGAATERMLEAAALGPGMDVLDLAAGSGETSVLAARRVGPTGSVLAIDISAPMLALASEAARAAGLDNVRTLVGDIGRIQLDPERFDAAISRMGLMFLDDFAAGVRRVVRSLRPGARLAAIVWGSASRNPFMGLPIEVVTELGHPPTAEMTIMRAFSVSEPARLARRLEEGGLRDVSVDAVPTRREFASLDEALDLLGTLSGAVEELTADMGAATREAFWREMRRRVADYTLADGSVVMTGEVLLARGLR